MRKLKMTVICLVVSVLMAAITVPALAEEVTKIDLNTATLEQLQSLDGIGASYAARIIEYRQTNGPFQKPEDLLNIKGIGEKTFEKIKDKIVVKAK